jgi:perosamine synthetase
MRIFTKKHTEDFIKLEEEFARFTKTKHCVVTNNGTSALTLALASLGIKKGDEVIVPEFTMIATAWAVSYLGATPVFVDCGDDLNIDPLKVKTSKNTKAIMATHVYGRRANIKELKKFGLPIIEDACEAHGSGKLEGDIACYSFYKNKIIHGEEGGATVTNSRKIANKARSLRNMSFGKTNDYYHKEIGFNFRMPNSQARLILKSLHNYPKAEKKRRRVEGWYNKYLGAETHRDAVWVFDLLTDNPKKIIKKLYHLGVRPFFKPMSQQPMYAKAYKHLNAYKYSLEGLYLPVNETITEEEVKDICDFLKKNKS